MREKQTKRSRREHGRNLKRKYLVSHSSNDLAVSKSDSYIDQEDASDDADENETIFSEDEDD